MQSCLVSRELLCHFLRCLDDPQVEVLGLYYEVVSIAYFLLYLCYLLTGESRYDAVNKCCIDAARVLKPLAETLGQFPEVDVLAYAVFQHIHDR